MRFFLISDNIDTLVGLRFSGIEGIVVHEAAEVRNALEKAYASEDIAIVLITERLITLCHELVYSLKLNRPRPLIVEIPDRHGNGRIKDVITRYVRESIGIKI